METVKYPAKDTWDQLLRRPQNGSSNIVAQVKEILDDVRQNGDTAVKKHTEKFDKVTLDTALLSDEEWLAADYLDVDLKQAIDNAFKNINLFHSAQQEEINRIDISAGIQCWRKSVGIEKVGLYIPGGTAPLFSTLLMLGIPARLAGCKEITVCTPSDVSGKVHPAILYAAKKIGISSLYKIGGVQAIAAMAYGTKTVPGVYKIFGPGNSYVTCAKMLVAAEGIAIDMPAGPSELAILADESCIPAYVAADLLSQAEHGIDSQVILVSTSEKIIEEVKECIQEQTEFLTRKKIVAAALTNSKAILVNSLDKGIELLNAYAPEHLIIACSNDEELGAQVINAGSVFLGNYAPESAGDYATGTNHTLPTNGFAKAYSGVSVDSFVKKISFQKLSKAGIISIANTVINMANAEGLDAHANAISIRINKNEQL